MHLHSTASNQNDEWYSRDFGCPESFAAPRRQYELCKSRGMSLVTLTDHDTIAGGLELISQPDFFLSEEVTAEFPEDGCSIHILAWNITPAQHDLLQAARPSVYNVVEVLRREKIVHACAHPLFSPNKGLTVAALERMLVLFPTIETVNGLMDRRLEHNLSSLLTDLDDPGLEALAQRHGLVRPRHQQRGRVAGSDAHSEGCTASCFTAVDNTVDVRAFLDAVAAGQAKVHGQSADLDAMNKTVNRVTYGYLAGRRLESPTYRDPIVDLVDVVTGREQGTDTPTGMRDEVVRSMLKGAARTQTKLGSHLDLDTGDEDAMTAMRRVHDGLIGNAFEELFEAVSDLDMYRAIGGIRDLASAAATAIPFLFAANHFAAQRHQAAQVVGQWTASPRPTEERCLAIFSDSIDHVDGVTSSLRRFVRRSVAEGRNVRIPYCGALPPDADTTIYAPLGATTTHGTSLYEGIDLHVPSPLGTIDWLWRHDITHVELATPGPMGIIGLFAARLLRLPVTASYHTEVPELLRHLSGSAVLHKAAASLAGWFYRAVDRVSVFSEASRQRLIALGVPAERIEYVPVAIDTEEFSPIHASPEVFKSFGISARCERIILTVGRLSREKNVPLIIEAIGKLQHLEHPPTLVVVGDGPERERLTEMCANRPYVVFLGLQQGDTLKRLYATASAFVFASKIDTLGLAPMEAMASGLPVIVPADTAISELVTSGVSGSVYSFGLEGLVGAIEDVLHCPVRRASLARAARAAMVARAAPLASL